MPIVPDILIVEDVRATARQSEILLTKKADFKVEVAKTGKEAIDLYKRYHTADYQGKLKIILMDIGLPDTSGIEVTQQIRNYENANKLATALICGFTASVNEDQMLKYQECGMNGCIEKGSLLIENINKMIIFFQDSPHKFLKPTQFNSPINPPEPAKKLVASTNLVLSNKNASFHITEYPNILIVEDVKISLRLTKAALERENYKVVTATSGEEAVKVYNSYKKYLQIILMDINLPKMTGLDAVQEIRLLEKESHIIKPVLIFGLTGNVSKENIESYKLYPSQSSFRFQSKETLHSLVLLAHLYSHQC